LKSRRSSTLRRLYCAGIPAVSTRLQEKAREPFAIAVVYLAIHRRSSKMLYYAVVFLVIALVAGLLGFGGIAGASAGIAQILFFVFLALLVLSLIAGLFRRA
jgi:uncharacterized membrane protein YtjA (UPF0391 family)